jgi:hypothetical protein
VPAHLPVHFGGLVDHVRQRQAISCFQANNIDTFLSQLIRHRAAAGTGTDHDNDGIVVKLVASRRQDSSGNQSISPAPRCRYPPKFFDGPG